MGLVAMLDVAVGWGLWMLLRSDAPRSAAFAMAARIAYALLLGAAVIRLAAGGDGAARAAAFHRVFDPALGLFGLHLLFVSAAVARTRLAGARLRAVLALVVALAGLGYLADAIAPFVIGNPTTKLGAYTFFGEIVLMVWLLIAAVRGRPSTPASRAAE
jgi:hypothetical protein